MNIACSTRWCAGVPSERTFADIRAAGFGFVELVPPNVPDESFYATSNNVLQRVGLRPSGLHWTGTDSPASIRDGFQKCRDHGLAELTVLAGPRREESMQYFVQTLELALAGMSADMSLRLVNRNGTRLEQLEDFRELFLLVQHPRLSVAVDVAEFHRACVNPAGAILELSDRMARLIVGDLIGDARVALNEGEVNIRAVIEQARRVGYNRGIVLDPFVADPNAPQGDLAGEYERLQSLLEA